LSANHICRVEKVLLSVYKTVGCFVNYILNRLLFNKIVKNVLPFPFGLKRGDQIDVV